MKFTMGLAVLAGLGTAPAYAAPTLTTIANFTGTNGSRPVAGLVADAAGNLYGTTTGGGAGSNGTVFEIPNTGGAFGALTTVASLPANTAGFALGGTGPAGGLTVDASGNLFGTANSGGTFGGHQRGTVFEVPNTGGGYGALTTVWNFTGTTGIGPSSAMTADASGNLFGTTSNTVYEIPKTAGGYGTLSVITTAFGSVAPLTIDASGNLLGTNSGGAYGQGSVFEIPNTGGTYGTPLTLGSFNVSNGASPLGGVTADASGNLFGTTYGNGGTTSGTVFEIPKTASGYGAMAILAYMDGTSGAYPQTGVIVDAAGDLFGTANYGGPDGDQGGTVWELPNEGGSYGPFVNIVTFNTTDGDGPDGLLLADSSGNLFGTTVAGGANNLGTVFEITGSGFVTATSGSGTPAPEPASILTFCAGTAALSFVRRRRRQK